MILKINNIKKRTMQELDNAIINQDEESINKIILKLENELDYHDYEEEDCIREMIGKYILLKLATNEFQKKIILEIYSVLSMATIGDFENLKLHFKKANSAVIFERALECNHTEIVNFLIEECKDDIDDDWMHVVLDKNNLLIFDILYEIKDWNIFKFIYNIKSKYIKKIYQ